MAGQVDGKLPLPGDKVAAENQQIPSLPKRCGRRRLADLSLVHRLAVQPHVEASAAAAVFDR